MLALAAWLAAVSFGLGYIAMPICMALARRWNVLDHPGDRKVHRDPIPLAGGWAIFGVFTAVVGMHLLGAWLLRDFEGLPDTARYFALRVPELVSKIAPVWVGGLCVFLLGLFDDVHGLSARLRFVFQLGIASVLVLLGYGPDLGFLPGAATFVIGVLWIVGITNAFNLLDGLDGLSAGVAFISTLGLVSVMQIGHQPDWLFYLAVVAGSLLAFLRYNWHPAQTFLGSSGSLTVGYLLAMASLLVTYTPPQYAHNPLMPLLTPILILAIPIYDTASVVLIRITQKRPIAIGDQSHFHHRMMRMGYSQPQAAIFILLVALAVALSGVGLAFASPLHAALILVQAAAILAVLVLAEYIGARVAAAVQRRGIRANANRPEEGLKHAEAATTIRASSEPAKDD